MHQGTGVNQAKSRIETARTKKSTHHTASYNAGARDGHHPEKSGRGNALLRGGFDGRVRSLDRTVPATTSVETIAVLSVSPRTDPRLPEGAEALTETQAYPVVRARVRTVCLLDDAWRDREPDPVPVHPHQQST